MFDYVLQNQIPSIQKPSWLQRHVFNKFWESAENEKKDEDADWTDEVLEGFHL